MKFACLPAYLASKRCSIHNPKKPAFASGQTKYHLANIWKSICYLYGKGMNIKIT